MADTFTNSEIGRKLTDLISRDDFGKSYFYEWTTSNAAIDLPIAPGMTKPVDSLQMILDPVTGLAGDLANGIASVQLVANSVTGQVSLATIKAQQASDAANSSVAASGLSGSYSNVSGIRADNARAYMELARDQANSVSNVVVLIGATANAVANTNTNVVSLKLAIDGLAAGAGANAVIATGAAANAIAARDVTLTYRDAAALSNTGATASKLAAANSAANALVSEANSNTNRLTATGAASNAVIANAGAWSAKVGADGVLTTVNAVNATVTVNKNAAGNSATLAGVYAAQAAVYASAINPANYVTNASLTWANVASKPAVFPSDIANVTGLATALTGKLDTGSFTYLGLGGKPTYFPTDTANVAGLQATLDNKLTAYPGIALNFAAFQFNSFGFDSAQGDGLGNIVIGGVHAKTANASALGYNFTSTGRGAARIGGHDSAINTYVANTATGVAGQAIGWIQTMTMSATAANFLVPLQVNSVAVATTTDLSTGLATKQNSLGYTPANLAGATFTGAVAFSSTVTIGGGTPWTSSTFTPSTKLDVSAFTWSGLSGKPTTFAPSAHTHTTAEVTGLDTALAAKAPLSSPSFTGNLTTTGSMFVGAAGGLFVTAQNHRIVFDPATGARVTYRGDHATAVGINLQTSAGGLSGAIYSDGNGSNFGFLNTGNGWRLRTYSGGASIYTDAGVENKLWSNGNIPNDAWQTSVDGKGRFWFATNSDSIWKTANDHAWRNNADTTIMSLTAAGSLSLPSGNIRAVSTGGTGQFTAISGSTMAGFYCDGTTFYILKNSASNTTFDAHRPLYVSLSTGSVTLDGTGAGGVNTGGALNTGGAVQVGTTLRALQSIDATTQAGSGMGVRIRARSDNVNAILQFTDTGSTAQWTSLVSSGAGDLTCTTGFTVGGEAYANSWLRSNTNGTGWYHQINGGGIYMNEATTVKVYGDKHFYTAGTITMGAFNVSSDRRLKSNIVKLTGASAILDATNVYEFTKRGKRQFGVIAQEVRDIAPLLVSETTEIHPVDKDPILSVDLTGFIPLLIDEVKSMRARLARAGL